MPELFDNYGEFIRELPVEYGPQCWFIIDQADVRMRFEHFERISTQLESQHEKNTKLGLYSDYKETMPWDCVFDASICDTSKLFWHKNVRDKCILFLAKVGERNIAPEEGA